LRLLCLGLIAGVLHNTLVSLFLREGPLHIAVAVEGNEIII
jgi:hypothetical protein